MSNYKELEIFASVDMRSNEQFGSTATVLMRFNLHLILHGEGPIEDGYTSLLEALLQCLVCGTHKQASRRVNCFCMGEQFSHT